MPPYSLISNGTNFNGILVCLNFVMNLNVHVLAVFNQNLPKW